MAAEDFPPPIKLMSFVSQEQLDEAKRNRGARVEDGTAQRDRPLYEILKENKDKKDAEFNERFKHKPPKALDEDETEFLDKLEMSRREYEQKMADDEAQQLRSFQAAIAAHSTTAHELKEAVSVPRLQEQKSMEKRKPRHCSLGVIVKVKPQAKKAKVADELNSEGQSMETLKKPDIDTEKPLDCFKTAAIDESHAAANSRAGPGLSLVSYSDGSDDDDN